MVKSPPASAADAGDRCSLPALERSPEEEMATHGKSMDNPMDRGAWQATVHGVTRIGYD